MSNLSELLPTGGGQNAVDFVATGTLSSGQTVALKSDGTVTAITGNANPAVVGTETTFASASIYYTQVSYATDSEKIVIAYRDTTDSNQGKAVVGTVSGTTISFGTPAVFDTGNSQFISMVYIGEKRVAISYMDGNNSNYGTTAVGYLSGNNIYFVFATPVVFGSHTSYYISSSWDSTESKLLVFYGNANSNYAATLRTATISFNGLYSTITFHSPLTIDNYGAFHTSCVYDPVNQKTICAYADAGSSQAGRAFVVTISGTNAPSIGTITTFQSISVQQTALAYDSTNEKIILVFRTAPNGHSYVGTVSGTSISFGTEAFYASAVANMSVSFNSSTGKVVVLYEDLNNSRYGTFVDGTASGTTITFNTPTIFNSDRADYIASAYDSTTEKIVVGFRDSNVSGYGNSLVIQGESSNNTDFIGITTEAISNAATGAVTVYGQINEAQTGLTIGADYYVQNDGSLATTPAAKVVKVGQAISATTINMMDLT